jgi:hypothetical protein
MLRRQRDYIGATRRVGQQFGATAAPPQQEPLDAPPRAINVDTVVALHRPRVFTYRDHVFVIEKVPAVEGMALEFYEHTIDQILAQPTTKAAWLELRDVILACTELMWSLTNRRRRWWRRQNPFARMTYPELRTVLTFFLECKMLLPDLALGSSQGSSTIRLTARRSISLIA